MDRLTLFCFKQIENILISESGTFLLCDFGSATTKVLCSSTSNSVLAIEDEIKRYTTLGYRAPEMIDIYSGQPITTKSDIWAFGCLLYKVCFYQLPFGESTLAIQNAQLSIPDVYEGKYSDKLLMLIGHMLTADPQKRPDIYQVASMVFELAAGSSGLCPVKNVENSITVPWSALKIPPLESVARDTKQSRQLSSGVTSGNNITFSSPGQDTSVGTTTTTVAPRQRPKGNMIINLPKSPVSLQRSPIAQSDRVDGSNQKPLLQTSNDASLKLELSSSSAVKNWSSSSSSSSITGNVSATGVPSSVHQHSKQSSISSTHSTSSINPIIESSSKNPFITSIPVLPAPPSSSSSSRRNTQTPPDLNFFNVEVNESSSGADMGVQPSAFVSYAGQAQNSYHHRRNQSETSAFPEKLSGNSYSSANSSTISRLSHSNSFVSPPTLSQQPPVLPNRIQLAGPPSQTLSSSSSSHALSSDACLYAPAALVRRSSGGDLSHSASHHHHSRGRSLNPFEESFDASYEDQLFGHEFDKIRQENSSSCGSGVSLNNAQLPQSFNGKYSLVGLFAF